MDKKKIIISIVIFIFIAAGIGYSVIKNKQPKYKFWVARKGEIIQKVSATGKVSPKKEIDLGFEIQGKIKKINIKVGDKAEKGQVLVSLDKDELNSQFLEAKANFESAKANLDKVQAGPSQEEIKIYEQAVKNARIALDNAETTLKDAEKTLADTKAQAKQNLDQAYQDALVGLDDAFLKLSNAFNFVKTLRDTDFYKGDQESVTVNSEVSNLEKEKNYFQIFFC